MFESSISCSRNLEKFVSWIGFINISSFVSQILESSSQVEWDDGICVTYVREILNKHKYVLFRGQVISTHVEQICSISVLFQGEMFSIKWECQLPEWQILVTQKSL